MKRKSNRFENLSISELDGLLKIADEMIGMTEEPDKVRWLQPKQTGTPLRPGDAEAIERISEKIYGSAMRHTPWSKPGNEQKGQFSTEDYTQETLKQML